MNYRKEPNGDVLWIDPESGTTTLVHRESVEHLLMVKNMSRMETWFKSYLREAEFREVYRVARSHIPEGQ